MTEDLTREQDAAADSLALDYGRCQVDAPDGDTSQSFVRFFIPGPYDWSDPDGDGVIHPDGRVEWFNHPEEAP